MQLRSFSVRTDIPREVAQEALTSSLADGGWRIAKELDDWSSIVQTREPLTPQGAFVPVSEIRYTIGVGPNGETMIEIEQTRHTWLGKGGIVDAKRAGERFDDLTELLTGRMPVEVEVEVAS